MICCQGYMPLLMLAIKLVANKVELRQKVAALITVRHV